MSILIDSLRDYGMHPICEQAADEIETLEQAYASLFKKHAELQADVTELRHAAGVANQTIAALKSCEVDAKRYRWLRAQHWDSSPLAVVSDPKKAVKLGHDLPSLDRLDVYIDSAMQPQPLGGSDNA